MTRSLRSRLAALVLTALVCITAVLVIVLVRGDARQVERERAALLVQGLTIGQAAIADDLLVEDYARARGFLATLALDPQVRFAALVDDDDRIIVHVGRRHENKRLEDVLPADALPLVARVRARLTAEVSRISNGELIAMSPVALGGNGVRLRSGRVGLLILCSGDRAALARAYARTAVEVSAITLIVLVLLLVPVIRDRAKPGKKAVYDHGNSLKDKRFTAVVSIIVFIVLDALVLIIAMRDLREGFWNDPLPDTPGVVRVEVLGQQWSWNFRLAGTDGEFGTPDDIITINELTVPEGRPVDLNLTSKDVIHSFYLPDMRLKRDLNPGAVNEAWFEALRPGRFDILCAELCGFAHYQMHGKLTVLTEDEFDAWEAEASRFALASYDENDAEAQWAWAWQE